MSDLLYREIILEHWKNPQNYGVLDHADIDLTESNPLCGDEIRLTVCHSPEEGNLPLHQDLRVDRVMFTGQGCAISMAAASILTERVKGLTLNEVKAITQQAFLEELGTTLTPARLKCALLAYSTLQKCLICKTT